jgi:hypothetical protein
MRCSQAQQARHIAVASSRKHQRIADVRDRRKPPIGPTSFFTKNPLGGRRRSMQRAPPARCTSLRFTVRANAIIVSTSCTRWLNGDDYNGRESQEPRGGSVSVRAALSFKNSP